MDIMPVSSVLEFIIGMKEPEYTRISYTLTLNVAQTLSRLNPEMTFATYLEPERTARRGQAMWARVKGKTENDLARLHFKPLMIQAGFYASNEGLKIRCHSTNISVGYILLYPLFPNPSEH